MITSRVKLLVWSAACVIGVGVAGYVALYFQNQDEYMQTVSTERMRDTLENVPDVAQREDNLVAVELVERGLKRLDWTGKPPPAEPEPVEADSQPSEDFKQPVSDFLAIRAIRFDGEAPDFSEVVFKYKSEARVTLPRSLDGTVLKRAGDTLDGRLNQIKIAAIHPTSVEFEFLNEPGREHEFVPPAEYALGSMYAYIGEGQQPVSRASDLQQFVRRVSDGPSSVQTVRISPNRFRLGSEDVQLINDDYPRILTEEIEIGTHRDPKTRKADGIEVKRIAPGSVAARHGVAEGDVIKSINGHPVADKDAAILFVKNNKDKYDRWDVEVWNRGQTRTITYYPPNK